MDKQERIKRVQILASNLIVYNIKMFDDISLQRKHFYFLDGIVFNLDRRAYLDQETDVVIAEQNFLLIREWMDNYRQYTNSFYFVSAIINFLQPIRIKSFKAARYMVYCGMSGR